MLQALKFGYTLLIEEIKRLAREKLREYLKQRYPVWEERIKEAAASFCRSSAALMQQLQELNTKAKLFIFGAGAVSAFVLGGPIGIGVFIIGIASGYVLANSNTS